MMNNRRASRILLLLVGRQFFRIAEASTAFSIHSDPTCTNGLSMSNVQMVCDDDSSGGSSTCFLGDSAHVTGTLSIPDSGLFGNSMTTQACLYGFYPCHQLETNGDFCDTFGLSSYGCPTTGEFSVEKTFKLPGDQGLSLGKTFVLCLLCHGETRSPPLLAGLLVAFSPFGYLTISSFLYCNLTVRLWLVLYCYIRPYQR
jgi:hypothetical protein